MTDPVVTESQPNVGLFVTCLVDGFRPAIGMATIELLEAAGCRVVVPQGQTCCGQPGFNTGEQDTARAMARMLIESFADVDYVVVPSGSCAGMIKLHYAGLFEPASSERAACESLAARCYELSVFLRDVLQADVVKSELAATFTYHDSCSGLRELDIKQQPRQLLSDVASLKLSEMEDSEVCCGFGGTFCVKYPEISTRMVDEKIDSIAAAQADYVLGGDLGCLLNIAGRLKRLGRSEKVYHFAEVLAGRTDVAPIGEPEKGAK